MNFIKKHNIKYFILYENIKGFLKRKEFREFKSNVKF